MSAFGVVVHGGRQAAVDAGRAFVSAATRQGHRVVALRNEAAEVGAEAVDRMPEGLDLIVSLGGDGTLLRAFRHSGPSVPVLGINYGRLGFLTVAAEHGPSEILSAIQSHLVISERLVLEVRGHGEPELALNDVIIEKPEPGRAVRVDMSVDDDPVIGWTTDGVIVSSPTGSTAYSFSAGGPLVDPNVACMVITPVSPHGLFDRSIVVDAGRVVKLRLDPEGDGGLRSIDGGPATALLPGDEVTVRAASARARLASFDGPGFWDRIREKFGVTR